MDLYSKVALLLVVLYVVLAPGAAQARQDAPPLSSDILNHHVIVLIDRSGSVRNNSSENQRRIFSEGLSRLCLQPEQVEGVPAGRPLLDAARGDLLSIIGFGLPRGATVSFRTFIDTLETGSGGASRIDFGFTYRSDFGNHVFDQLWSQISGAPQSFFRKDFGMITLAAPMGIAYLHTDRPRVNRTFLIVVTDGQFNNPNQEPSLELQIAQERRFEDLQLVRQAFQRITSEYLINAKKIRSAGRDVEALEHGNLKLRVYEVGSKATNFSIESVINYDIRRIAFDRTKDGFRATYDLNLIDTLRYRIEKFEAVLVADTDTVDTQVRRNIDTDQRLVFDLDSKRKDRDLRLDMRFWVHLKDEGYGAHMLHPNGSVDQGSAGLIRTVAATFEPPASILFVIPLPKVLFEVMAGLGAETQTRAALFVNLTILVLFLVTLTGLLVYFSKDRRPVLLDIEW